MKFGNAAAAIFLSFSFRAAADFQFLDFHFSIFVFLFSNAGCFLLFLEAAFEREREIRRISRGIPIVGVFPAACWT